jgi:O-antigen ligase
LFFWIAVTGWVAGFWLFTGRYEQAAWCVWVLFPVAVWNGRQVLDLWLGMSRESRGWWVLLGSLIGWQLLITGLRAGNWWVGPGAGKDALLVFALVSGLVMVGRDEKGRNWLWKGVFAAGLIGVLASLIAFYPEMRIHEERFRLCWRWWPGFDAVTTGIFTGMALMVGLITGENGRRWWRPCVCAALTVLGFGLAASESRGALLAVAAGAVWWLLGNVRLWHRLLWPLGAFAAYWVLVGYAAQGRSGLVERGSSGRFDIYQSYLSQMAGSDWVVGKGQVWMLPESVLGWLVDHPHNAYLGQLAAYGIIGLLLMLATLTWGFLKMRKTPESAILVFGLVTLLFDGGMVFSMFSTARWEALVVMVPLVMGVAAGGMKEKEAV